MAGLQEKRATGRSSFHLSSPARRPAKGHGANSFSCSCHSESTEIFLTSFFCPIPFGSAECSCQILHLHWLHPQRFLSGHLRWNQGTHGGCFCQSSCLSQSFVHQGWTPQPILSLWTRDPSCKSTPLDLSGAFLQRSLVDHWCMICLPCDPPPTGSVDLIGFNNHQMQVKADDLSVITEMSGRADRRYRLRFTGIPAHGAEYTVVQSIPESVATICDGSSGISVGGSALAALQTFLLPTSNSLA